MHMTRQVSKPNIFWAPSLETARKIDDENVVKSIETARYRFAASMADLERCYDEQASRLRAAFVAEGALPGRSRVITSPCRVSGRGFSRIGGEAEGMARSLFWLSDEAWKTLEPHLPHGKPGKPRVDDRTVISGILHVLKTGCRWRDVPPAYGPPTTVYNRDNRWSQRLSGSAFSS